MTNNNNILVVIAVLLVGILGVLLVNQHERATPGDKISNGINQIGEGIDDAAHNITKH
jgi:hypothetical protein